MHMPTRYCDIGGATSPTRPTRHLSELKMLAHFVRDGSFLILFYPNPSSLSVLILFDQSPSKTIKEQQSEARLAISDQTNKPSLLNWDSNHQLAHKIKI
jgi:hypothetical protein